ncbi:MULTISPECIES: cobalt transporter CbiM [unclassified Synechocystis]|uniref:cobalt transporter CbiM n=1 Tax=unclassified Synechocystis TaxID=2640012 RepID=UPI0004140699|nr:MULTISPECIES: cobalt transporter CbiM [unclassified Synechocystis]AIE74053.1 Substrate-specific component NikM of nickel ECF transporter [Synechocystis sp. PCC 6714]MCT0252702.1 cobalt transporter CbiM [Synechocystis sp. CS-94]
MHIPDGLLPPQIVAGGYAVTGLATWYCLRQINRQGRAQENIPKASLLTAAFFVASSIYIPLPPVSIHLILNGLLGVILGYFALPAILIGLFFQALMVGHGGLTTLGINGVLMGLPALGAYYIFQLRHGLEKFLPEPWATGIGAFLGGSGGLALTVLIFIALTVTSLPTGLNAAVEYRAIMVLALGHLPLILLEGIFTAMVVLFLQRTKPELLGS